MHTSPPAHAPGNSPKLINGVAALLTVGYFFFLFPLVSLEDDFLVYYQAAQAFRNGLNPYDIPAYVYSPIFVYLLQPLSTVSIETARIIWFVVHGSLLAGLVGLAALIAGGAAARRYWAVIMLITALAIPTYFDLILGQVGVLIGFLCVASYALQKYKKPGGSLLLALAIIIKIYPVILLLGYAAQKRWSLVRNTTIATVLLGMVTFFLAGPAVSTSFITKLAQGSGYPYAAESNSSLSGFWLRLLTDNGVVPALINLPPLAYAAIAVSSLIVLYCAARAGSRLACSDLQFSLWLCVILLVFPGNNLYNMTILLLPILIIFQTHARYPPSRFRKWLLFFAIALLYFPPLSTLASPDRSQLGPLAALYFTPLTYVVLVMFSELLILSKQEHHERWRLNQPSANGPA